MLLTLVKSLSATKIRTFLTCPRQYAFRYVEKLEEAGPRPLPLTVGILLHRSFPLFVERAPTSPADVIDVAARICSEATDIGTLDELQDAQSELTGLLLDLHRHEVQLFDSTCSFEMSLIGRVGPMTIFSRADVFRWQADFAVIDEIKLSPPDADAALLQTVCIHVGARQRFPGVPIVHRRIVFRPAISVEEIQLDEPQYRATLRLIFDVAKLIARMQEFTATPSPTACSSCSYAGLCPAARDSVDATPY
jgi:CRISPR/Cas system-associated exonuclease Cas4 (RecB family)